MLVFTCMFRLISFRAGTSMIWSISYSKNSRSHVRVTPSVVAPMSVHPDAENVEETFESAGSVAPNAAIHRVPGPAMRLLALAAIDQASFEVVVRVGRRAGA